MLQTNCFAWYTLRKRGWCGGDESGGTKCDDRCLHFSVLPPWNKRARVADSTPSRRHSRAQKRL